MESVTIRGKLGYIYFKPNGDQTLTLEIKGDFREWYDKLERKDLSIEFTPYKEKRSKNANAYMWELCGKLSETVGLPAIELYRNAIKQVGVYKDVEFLREKDAKTMATAWQNLGIGWFCEKLDYTEDGDGIVMRCYYGSSSYNKKQMSRLIDDIVEDCKALGIECGTEQERTLLLDTWKEKSYA